MTPYDFMVVNCFQFDYFCGYHTAIRRTGNYCTWLWIAFNLITFVDITQLVVIIGLVVGGCELLSIWLLLWISHSNISFHYTRDAVVNCFQFDYFCGYHTANNDVYILKWLLWIAFNLITFVDITQLKRCIPSSSVCCELLSIWLLLWISHSSTAVICFTVLLWIAFNLITFVDITQRIQCTGNH